MDSINGIKTKEIDDINKHGHELLPLTNDYVFRRVFADENTDALAEFIFCVTGMPASELDDIQVDDPHLHPEGEGMKRGELDVRVHTKSGGIVNVEIQLKSERAFRERIVYYSDRLFASRIKKGDSYGALNKTIMIARQLNTTAPLKSSSSGEAGFAKRTRRKGAAPPPRGIQ